MLLIILSICLGIFAVAALLLMTLGTATSKHATLRLAALDHELLSTGHFEQITDIRRSEKRLSAIPWLNHWLTRMNLSAVSSLYLYQAGVTQTLGSLALISVAVSAFLGALLYSRFGLSLPVILLSAGSLSLPFLYVQRKRASRLFKLEQQLPEALGMMVSALRVGHSLVASLGAVAQESPAPIGAEM